MRGLWYNVHMQKSKLHNRIVLVFLHSMNETKLSGIYDFATKHGWHVQVIIGTADSAKYSQHIHDWKPSGCIVDGMLRQRAEFPPRIKGVHVVQLGNSFPASPLRHVVVLDNRAISQMSADILMNRQPVAFAYIPAPDNPTWSMARCRHFAQAIRRARHGAANIHVANGGNDLHAYTRFLKEIPKPAGIMRACDDIAPTVFNAARNIGLRIPEDLCIVSVDNNQQLCNNLSPTLTSIEPDFASGGYLAMELLAKIAACVSMPHKHQTYGIATVAVRRSTIAAYSDRRVNNAVRWIETHATTFGTSAMDVVHIIGCSRRHSEHIFHKTTGKTIGGAIADARFEAVEKHLRDNHRNLEFIASGCGFSSAAYLAASFKKRYGMTTRQWCKANALR